MDLTTYAITVITERYDFYDEQEKKENKSDFATTETIADYFENIFRNCLMDKLLLNCIMHSIDWDDVLISVIQHISESEVCDDEEEEKISEKK